MRDYYEILKIDRDASRVEVKRAFRREALKWHPDRNKSPDSTKRMQLINEAYLILSDDEARPRYDREYKDYTEISGHAFSGRDENYSFNDPILRDWINRARTQAKNMAAQSLTDLRGMTKAAFLSAFHATKFYVLLLLVVLFWSMTL